MRRLLVALSLLALSASPALAHPVEIHTHTPHSHEIRSAGHFGLGLGSGTLANGLSAKYYMNGNNALQFNFGVFGGRGIDNRWHRFGGIGFSADYLFELPAIARAGNTFELGWNIGGGLGIGFDSDRYDYKDHYYDDYTAVAASLVVGFEFNFLRVPLDFVIEFRPGIFLVPYVAFNPLDITAHVRFYF